MLLIKLIYTVQLKNFLIVLRSWKEEEADENVVPIVDRVETENGYFPCHHLLRRRPYRQESSPRIYHLACHFWIYRYPQTLISTATSSTGKLTFSILLLNFNPLRRSFLFQKAHKNKRIWNLSDYFSFVYSVDFLS